MNFSELKTELAARGFDYLSDTRLGRYINLARAELDDSDLWPYLEKSVTGTAPVTVTDLGHIEAVLDIVTGLPLTAMAFTDLNATYGPLNNIGTPCFYYVAWPDGDPVVATYPTSNEIGVQYWKVTLDLSGTDTPAAPTRFHYLIVDMAARMAYRDADDADAAAAIQAEIDKSLLRMRFALGCVVQDGPADYVRTTNGGWF